MVLYLTIVGVILTAVGAFLIGWNDLMSKEKAVEIGVPRWASDKMEENLQLPLVQELLRRNKNSRRGLFFVIFGAIFLILASLF